MADQCDAIHVSFIFYLFPDFTLLFAGVTSRNIQPIIVGGCGRGGCARLLAAPG